MERGAEAIVDLNRPTMQKKQLVVGLQARHKVHLKSVF